MRVASLLRRYAVEIGSLCTAIIIWQLVANYVVENALFLPSFTDVVGSFSHEWRNMVYDARVSLIHFGIGMITGLCVAVPLGVCMGWFPMINRIADPIISRLRSSGSGSLTCPPALSCSWEPYSRS
jgi:NitT/TauT family transport system permease protein